MVAVGGGPQVCARAMSRGVAVGGSVARQRRKDRVVRQRMEDSHAHIGASAVGLRAL